ncbi:NADP-dependent alkenal double bond reductase P2-like [Sesamum indicum]|uniref:NADP-dependent alkenal double bond reductase P2-like n=1 Tax=Sesamum indicum TaxID=4182 RepID=A0A6I9UH66_SESIN|nr:NADP-dependent alkenal double bond reductase P2-like [Sesamum indicum]
MEVRNKYVTTKNHIDGAPNASDFCICEESLSLNLQTADHEGISNDVVVVQNLYVSIDPYQINRMKTHSCSHNIVPAASAVLPGQGIGGSGVGRVVDSGNPDFKAGDVVSGNLNWGEYTVVKGGRLLQKLDTSLGFPLSYYAGGVLGTSGLTAYAGFFKVCKPKKGEKVFVSAACGSVGILVGQYAKLFGCYVVGCAGSKEKVDLLKNKIGFDDAFNYKEETDLSSTLERYFPTGIDIYFDNVGGEMLEAAIQNMNNFGRVTICGQISEYTNTQKRAKLDMIRVLYKRIRIKGFICPDFMDIYQEFISTTTQYLQTSKIKVIEDISYGVDSIPEAFLHLFHGNNIGKKVVRIAQD